MDLNAKRLGKLFVTQSQSHCPILKIGDISLVLNLRSGAGHSCCDIQNNNLFCSRCHDVLLLLHAATNLGFWNWNRRTMWNPLPLIQLVRLEGTAFLLTESRSPVGGDRALSRCDAASSFSYRSGSRAVSWDFIVAHIRVREAPLVETPFHILFFCLLTQGILRTHKSNYHAATLKVLRSLLVIIFADVHSLASFLEIYLSV
ncbi:hypothetical protein EDD85DRAFT_942297 [Armillaria nabsnona]|nr:hypothetical protein EDD85DRAFT_942297 [Armillaria nabsnona]